MGAAIFFPGGILAAVKVGGRLVGEGHPCYVIAEIGINHNGDVHLAKRLIDIGKESGCDAVKFQKRTVDVVYTAEQLAKPRGNPIGPANGDLKRGLEFDAKQYEQIDAYCREKGIPWFASCWDEAAVDFIDVYDPPCYKIASASLTDDALLKHTRAKGEPIMLSTGMSSHDEIHHAVQSLGKDDVILLHCCSTYPAYHEELNLRVIPVLKQQHGVPVGYSGHETGIASSVASAAIGVCLHEACRAGCLPTAYPSDGRLRGSTAANPAAHGGHDWGLRWQVR
jgi:N-acetylneuraminate synthase